MTGFERIVAANGKACTAPSFSVVIPCFNYAKYVASAIESALAQSHCNTQIVVVNDGSTDGSLEIISRYAGQVQVVDQPNLGSIAAYNRGFAAATGNVIVFLDADDVLDPDALTRVAEVWSPACAKVQYDLRIIDGSGQDLGRRFCNFNQAYSAERVREAFRRTGTYRWPVTVGNAYSRWFVEKLFPLAVELGPDGVLNTVAPVYGEVVTIPEPLGSYRIHGANMWASDGTDPMRLPYRIRHRRSEEALMRRHAAQRGVLVPEESILEHELAFINYRLMAQKLGIEYEGSAGDSMASLVWAASRHLLEVGLPLRLVLGHLSWVIALCAAPRPAARSLIRLRFNRSAVVQGLHHKLGALLSRGGARFSRARARFSRAGARAAEPAEPG